MTTWREIREMAEDIRRRADESVTATDIGAKAVALATEIALSEDQAERAVEEILQRAREVAEGNGDAAPRRRRPCQR